MSAPTVPVSSPPAPCGDCLRLAALPAPCAGVPYSVPLVPEGGVPPYRVEVVASSSPEFVLSAGSRAGAGALSRVESASAEGPSQGGTLSLRVSDSSEPARSAHIEIELSLRQACWFAYLAGDGATELHVRDVFLARDFVIAPEPAARVSDFQFSPNGDWLAFRAGAEQERRLFAARVRPARSGPARLVSSACPSGGGSPACDVVDYAWSSDSQHLAFVLRNAAGDSLAGASGFGGAQGPGAPWPAQSEATWVGQAVPLRYQGGLGWLGSETLAFLGAELGSGNPSLTSTLYLASWSSAAGPSRPDAVPPMLTRSSSRLRPLGAGVALVEVPDAPTDRVVTYHAPGGPAHYHSGWLAPSGSWVASATAEGTLELYAVGDEDTPVAALPAQCEAVYAWSEPSAGSQREQLACSAGEEVVFVEFDPGERTLRQRARVNAPPSPDVRRAFSRDGRWFALGEPGGNRFGVIDLDQPEPRVDPLRIVVEAAPGELSFPPARDGLLTLADPGGIAEYPLPDAASTPSAFSATGTAPRSRCSESFWSAPDNWCGAPRAAQHFEYAVDARSLLFEDAPRRLVLGQPGVDPDARLVTDVLAPCPGACAAARYAFQP